jgi:hypothetical protein
VASVRLREEVAGGELDELSNLGSRWRLACVEELHEKSITLVGVEDHHEWSITRWRLESVEEEL